MRKQKIFTAESLMDAIRQAGCNTLPTEGAWVLFKGNPYSPRGLRIPVSLREAGIRHWDIYWAYNEQCPWDLPRGVTVQDVLDQGESIDEYVEEHNGISAVQLTWMSLHTPASQLIRAWSGEVTKLSDGLVSELLASESYEVVQFAGRNPVWDEETRDIIGGLMLDGLNMNEAQLELVRAGELESGNIQMPSYFYRVIRDSYVWNEFCEEPEYEAWWKDKQEAKC